MTSSLSLKQRLVRHLARWLGIDPLRQRVVALEEVMRLMAAQQAALADAQMRPSVAAAPMPVTPDLAFLQKLTDMLATLDKKIACHRAADHLAQVSAIYPKTRSAVFIGRSYFGDNIKYAYLAFHAVAARHGATCTFMPRDERQRGQLTQAGLACLPVAFADYTPADIGALLSAQVVVADEQFVPPNWRQYAPHALLRGAKTVQLWHGIPLKQIALETAAAANLTAAGVAEMFASCGMFDMFVATAAASRPAWARRFGFRDFAAIGYPRNDVLLREPSPHDLINVDAEALAQTRQAAAEGKPAILYAPTFRDHGNSAWFDQARIARLADACAARGQALYVNLHPGEQDAVASFRQYYPTIRFLAPQTDIYPILRHIGMLVTDYSSLAFDFLLLDRPVIFYRPDHADYIARSRPLIDDHGDYLCGPVTGAIDDVIAAVTLAADLPPSDDPYRARRHALRDRLFDHHDGLAGQRLNELIVGMMKT